MTLVMGISFGELDRPLLQNAVWFELCNHWVSSNMAGLADVRFGSKADFAGHSEHVRFAPESGLNSDIVECPLSAKSRHRCRAALRTLASNHGR
jgi:hypothetical protein